MSGCGKRKWGTLMYRVCLVMCSKHKLRAPTRAKDLYVSDRFQADRFQAENYFDCWYILSAKHGLVDPGRIISPYDVELAHMSDSVRQKWGARVVRSLFRNRFPSSVSIRLFADLEYVEPLAQPLSARGFCSMKLSHDCPNEPRQEFVRPCSSQPCR